MFEDLFEPARMQFCERTLSGLIKHPADTWTNIGPIIAGIAIIRCAKTQSEKLLGLAALWTGIASGYFHASNTILGETLDLSGMFMYIASVAMLQRPQISDSEKKELVFVITAAATTISYVSAIFASPLFAVMVAGVVICELTQGKPSKWLWWTLGTFAVAWAFWWLDYTHAMCDPDNHVLTGHGVWHLLNGLVFWFSFLHWRQKPNEVSD